MTLILLSVASKAKLATNRIGEGGKSMPDVGVVTTEFIINRCGQLKNAWSNRARKFIDWYKVLLLNDELPQTGTESVVSNDPRTGFNLARHLLTSMTVADRIPSEDIPAEFLQG